MAGITRFAFAALIALSGMAGTAHAQALPPIEESITQGAQIEESVERATRTAEQAARDDQAIDGEAGVYVIKKEKIFYIAGNAGLGYSSNPLHTSDDVGGSFSADGSLSVGIRTRLAETLDFAIAANVEGTRYFENFAPSNFVATGNVSLGSAIPGTPLYAGVAAFGGWNFNEDFGNPVSFHGASAHISANIPIARNVIAQPAVVATRLWTQVEENDTKTVSARMAVTALRGPASLTVSASASRIWFDDFYEDVTFVTRNDWQYEAAASISYRLAPNVIVNATARYTKRDSPFFLADHKSFEAGLAVSALIRF